MTEEYFKNCIDNYYNTVFRMASACLHNLQDAEDVTEDVFITLYYKSPDFEDETFLKSWLLKVTLNKCRTLCRSFWKKHRDDDYDYFNIKVYDTKEESDIEAVISELPYKYQSIIYLYYYENYSIKDISEITGIKVSTCQSRLDRARKIIKQKLEDKDGDYYVNEKI